MKALAWPVVGAAIALSTGLLLAQAPVVRIAADQLKWSGTPEQLGFQETIIEGDPTKPGLYVIQVKFPPGVMSRPHFHADTRYATVIKGTWYTGEGSQFMPENTVGLKPGSFMKHPAGTHHFDGAKDEEVILQLVGIGPSTTTRIKPEMGLFDYSLKQPYTR